MRFSIVFAALAPMLAITPPAHFGNLQVAAAFAQDTGFINACATKEQVRIVASAGDCKKHETPVVLVSSGVYQTLLALLQQSQRRMEDQKQEILAAMDQKLAVQAANRENKP